jgi:membrane peptidoglycan carboxypeptidase
LIIAAFAVFIMLAGGGVVGFTYYSTNVTLPENVELPLATTIFYADGKTQLAKVGEVNRELVKIDKVPDYVQKAVASAEDRKFYEHGGVDYVGIMRAAWNNFTGGDTQGASTITQQYARNAMDLGGVTYARKVREAVLASKLNDRYAKSQIMEMYLNTIYFGRGAYGIEAAAKAYFNVPASKLTVEQGAVLAAVIKQPRPDPATGHKGYDPADNPEAAKTRWDYVLDGMVQKFGLDAAKRAAMQYPKAIAPPKDGACLAECGLNTPAGMAINYITKELVEKGICQEGHCMQELREGGYKIETSLDPKMQRAAEQTVSRKEKGSELAKQPANLMAALVSIDPNTGRVLAYFGGNNNSGHDYAGKNWENGQWTGGHPAGSTFKVYTLAAALDAGIGLQSHWDAKPFTVKGTEIKVQNAGRDVSRTCGSYCTLEYSTLQSYNVPFYYVTEKIGPDRVVDMAKRAGITMMWNTYPSKDYDLTQIKDAKQVAPAPFFNVVGYGQYPITVIDHANGVATLAARGMYHKAHFVVKVWQKDRNTGQWVVRSGEKVQGERRIREEVADNVNSVLQKIPPQGHHNLDDGRPATGKTGTWQLGQTKYNAHAWFVGATKQVATAVWVGNEGAERPILDKSGGNIGGAQLPGDIWERFMNTASKGMPVKQFAERHQDMGDDDAGNGISPTPNAPPSDGCLIPLFCPGNGGGPGGGGPGGGGGGGLPLITPSPTTSWRSRQ